MIVFLKHVFEIKKGGNKNLYVFITKFISDIMEINVYLRLSVMEL